MIKANFIRLKDKYFLGFIIKGHSGAAELGNDIVCSAVSSAAYMVVNTISEIIKAEIDTLIVNPGELLFKISFKNAKECQDILLGFRMHMISLEEQYPENVKVNDMEV